MYGDNEEKSKGKLPKSWVMYIVVWMAVLFAIRMTLFKGFDFTDATLGYHFSIKILDGKIPYVDFFTLVTPLAFYAEALFHIILGKGYWVNHILGAGNLVLQYTAIYLILDTIFSKRSALLFTLSLVLVVSLGQPVYFSYGPLAITLSLWFTYMLTISVSDIQKCFLLGLTVGLVFLTKQSYIAACIGGILCALFIEYSKKSTVPVRKIVKIAFGLSTVVIPFFLYISYNGGVSELLNSITTGSQKKGLDSVLDILMTVHGFTDIKILIGTGVSVIGVIISAVLVGEKNTRYMLVLSLIVFKLIAVSSFSFGSFGGTYYVEGALEVILYDLPRIFAVMLLISYLLFENVNRKVLFLSICVILFTSVAQLSWPGRGYVRPQLSSFYIFVIPGIITQIIGRDGLVEWGKCVPKSIRSYALPLLSAGLIVTLTAQDLVQPSWSLRRDFKPANSKVTVDGVLYNWQMSSKHATFIGNLLNTRSRACNKSDTGLMFPWSPVLYTITNLDYVGKYGVLWHDWVTLKQARQASKKLQDEKPCLIVIDSRSLNEGMPTPLPAEGTRYMEKFLQKYIPSYYSHVFTGKTYNGTKKVFVKK